MDNQQTKQTKQRESKDQPVVTLSDLMRSGMVQIDRVERGTVYYNAKIKLYGNEAMFQFPIRIEVMDEKFIFLSVEQTKVFRDQIREALDYNLVKQIY